MGKNYCPFRHQTLLFAEAANDSKSAGSFVDSFSRVFSCRGENFLGCHGRLSPKTNSRILRQASQRSPRDPSVARWTKKIITTSFLTRVNFLSRRRNNFSRDERVLLSSRKLARMLVHGYLAAIAAKNPRFPRQRCSRGSSGGGTEV